MLNPFGNIHGGVIFTLCDNAAGSYMANLGRYSVTMHSDLSFYRPAHLGDLLTARVDARKIGKTVSVLLVELRDQNGTRIADGTFQMFRVEKK